MSFKPTTRDRRKPPPNLSQFFSATLHALRIQAVWQITNWRTSEENKKTAIYRDRKIATFCGLLHVIPLAAVVALVALNMRTTYIGSVSTTALTAIQFASKLLEILIQGSITTMVLSLVRIQVLGSRSYPFGGFIASFRTTDVSYLWSLELWGSLTSACVRGWHKIVMCLLPGAVILSTLVGPSAAVLMIPRVISCTGIRELLFLNQSASEYPHSVELVNGQLLKESELNQTWYQAVSRLNNLHTGYDESHIDNHIQITDNSGIRTLQLSNITDPLTENTTSFATVPTQLSVQALSYIGLGRGAAGVFGQARQPYTRMDCWSAYTSTVGVGHDAYVDFASAKPYLQNLVSVAEFLPNFTKPENDTTFTTLPLGELSDTGTYNAVVWHRLPPEVNHSIITAWGSIEEVDSPDQAWYGLCCTIDAFWVATSTNYTPGSEATNDDAYEVLLTAEDKQVIILDPSWLKRIYAILLDQIQAATPSLLYQNAAIALALAAVPSHEGLGDSIYDANRTELLDRLSQQQTTTLLDYIEKESYWKKYDAIEVFTSSTDWTDPASLAQVETQSYVQGYGYDSTTVTVWLSLVVLLLYACAAAAFLTYTLITGSAATSWDSISEVVALALNSRRPDALENTSVGINTLETFRKPLSIRANEQGSAEIVIGEDWKGQLSAYSEIVPNKKY